MSIRTCDFCGFEFDPNCATDGGCQGCPLAGGCTHVTCPNCGYQMLPEAKLVGWMRKLAQKIGKQPHETQ